MKVNNICSHQHIKGYKESKLARGENNDCVVRAIASTFDMEYEVAHKFTKRKFDRKDRKGTRNTKGTFRSLAKEGYTLNEYNFNLLPDEEMWYEGSPTHQRKNKGKTQITLKMFLEKHPKGRFVVCIRGHAFSVVDGDVIGNYEDGKRLRAKIEFAVKVSK